MSTGIDVDFTPLTAHPTDPVSDFVNAFEAGRALARRGPPAQSVANPSPSTPAPANPGLGNPALGNPGLGNPGLGNADPAAGLAAIAALDGPAREAARQRSEQLGAVLLALQGVPNGPARLAMARHAAPAFGLDPAEVTPADVSDTGLAAHRAQAMMLQHLLTAAPGEPAAAGPGASPVAS